MSLQRKLNVKISLMFIVAENTGSVNIIHVLCFNSHITCIHSNVYDSPSMHFLVQDVWNAKLTETQIFRELSIEIESSLFN